MICRPEGGWRTIFSLINCFCFSRSSSVPLSSRLSAISLLLTKNLTSYYTVLTLNMQVFVRSEFFPIVNIGGCGILVRVNRIFCTTLRRLLIENEPESIKNPGIYENHHPAGKPCGLSPGQSPVPGTVSFLRSGRNPYQTGPDDRRRKPCAFKGLRFLFRTSGNRRLLKAPGNRKLP